MKRLLEKIRQMLNKRRTRRILTRVVSIVGALVVFVTTYALVLPAITMEKQAACGIEEHQHDDSCFEEQLICGEEESETHQHTAQCYERVMVCGKPSHVHSTECYQALEESAETESGITESGMGDVTEADPAAATDSTAAETGTADAAADGIDDIGTMEASDTNAGAENGSDTADAEDIDSARGGSETIEESGKTESGVEEDTGFDPVAVPDSSAEKTGTEDAAADETADTDTTNTSDANADSKNETGKADAKDTDSVRDGSTANKAADSAEKQKDDSLDSQAGAEAGKTSGAGAENSETAADAAEEKNETYAGLEGTLDLAEVLTDRTDFYYYPAQYDENGKADTESISSGSVTDWEKVKDNTEIAPEDFVRVFLAYTIPAGTLNKNHYTARYRLPGALRLTEDQIEAINKADNGVTRQMEATRDDTDASADAGLKDFPTDAETWRGAEAIEGIRTPDQKLNEGDTEYISATVKVENIYKDGEYQGQDLILTFAPYTVSKNQTTLAADGKTLAEGEKVKGFFALDLTPAQISCDETGTSEIRFAEESDADDTASGLFAHEEILRTLHLQDRTGDADEGTDADPAEKKENGTEGKDADTNTENQTEAAADSKADEENADGTDADPADQADASEDDKDKFLTGSVIAASGETYEVKVTYDDDAQIPDGSELRVKELLEEDDGYDDYCQQAVEKVEETSVAPADSANGNDTSAAGDNTSAADGTEGQTPVKKSTGYVRVFDIEIWNNDQKIEPSAEVLVEIRLLDAPENKKTNLDVVHFAEDGPEVLAADQNTQDTADTSLEFTTDAFSVYTIVETELVTEWTLTNKDGEDVTYLVKVTYGPEANIPDGATLSVRNFDEGTEDYTNARNAVLADKQAKGEWVDLDSFGLAALDISILDKDGNEIEPAAEVKVDIKIKSLPGVEDLKEVEKTLKIQHHVETKEGIIVDEVYNGSSDASFNLLDNDTVIDKKSDSAVNIEGFDESVFDFKTIDLSETEHHGPDEIVDLKDLGIDIEFNTPSFSSFTIEWSGRLASTNQVGYIYTSASDREADQFNDNGIWIGRTILNTNNLYFMAPDTSGMEGGVFRSPREDTAKGDLYLVYNRYGSSDGNISDSNSTFHIYFKNTDGQIYADVTVHYVDQNGNNIRKTYTSDVTFNGDSVDTSYADPGYYGQRNTYQVQNYAGTKSGYTFYRAEVKLPAISSGRATIIYEDEDGNELTVKNPASTFGDDNNDRLYLIYDIDGYEYSYTYRNTDKNDKIGPLLYNKGTIYTVETDTSTYGKYIQNGDVIHVVYKPSPEASKGGTPTLDYESSSPKAPKILKSSKDNQNGTNTLSLSIIGDTADAKLKKMADVIVIMDISGSMNFTMDREDAPYGQCDSYYYSYHDAKDSYTSTRIYKAYQSIGTFANNLLSKKNAKGEPLVRMSLVTFSDRAQIAQGFTSDYDTYMAKVGAMRAGGATNWEDALKTANTGFTLAANGNNVGEMELDPERATFVVFVTDGNPTYRMTRCDVSNKGFDEKNENAQKRDVAAGSMLTHNVFGGGNNDVNGNNFAAAWPQAKAIVDKNKIFYSIGISNIQNSLSNLDDLADKAGAGADHSIIANDEAALLQAFKDIEEKMQAEIGWGQIEMTDGITDLTNTVEKSELVGVSGTFKYWKATAPANWDTMNDEERKAFEEASTTNWQEWGPVENGKLPGGANPAVYDKATGSVKWNMGSDFMLEKNTIYRVTFDCWPTQAAFDTLANLNNGKVKFSDLSPEVQNQINEPASPIGKYTVKTNKDGANTTYKHAVNSNGYTGVQGDPITIPFQEVAPMPLNGEEISVLKDWAHGINEGHEADTVKFHLLVDGKLYQNDGTFKPKTDEGAITNAFVIEVSKNSKPTAWMNKINIAPGVIRNTEVLETGHSYKLEEFEATGVDNYEFSYEFKSQTVRPMNVNGTLRYFVEVDDENPGTGFTKHSIDGRTYHDVAGEGTQYYEVTGSNIVLKATNHKTSELDITKMIVKGEGAGDKTEAQLDQETFMYRVTLEIPKGGNIDGITGYLYFKYPEADKPFDLYGYTSLDNATPTAFSSDVARFDVGKVFRSWNTTNAVIKSSMLTTREDGTQVITMDIPQSRNEVIRFTNLPTGTKYTIQEVYANKTKPARGPRQPGGSNSIEGTPPSTAPSNLSEQGYSVTQIASKTSNQADNDAAIVRNTDTVTGTISTPDTRYYNQFTNTLGKHADVKIDVTKHLDGYAWNGEKYFFKLAAGTNTAGVETPMPLTGRNPIYVSDAAGSTADKSYGFDKIRFVKAGEYNYTITEVDENGASLAGQVINGIKYDSVKNVKVTVTEEGNKLVAVVTGDNTTSQTAAGLVTSNTKMTNSCGAVKVKKIDKDSLKKIEGAVFELRDGSERLYLKDSTGMTMSASQVRIAIGVDPSVSLDSDEAKAKMTEAGISASFTIGERDLKGLTYNKVYTLHEITPPEGYITTANDSTFKITINAQGNTVVELTGNNVTQTVEGNTIVILVSNTPGEELPYTGGPGTFLYTLSGIALICVSALMYGFRMRRRERRLK